MEFRGDLGKAMRRGYRKGMGEGRGKRIEFRGVCVIGFRGIDAPARRYTKWQDSVVEHNDNDNDDDDLVPLCLLGVWRER